MQNELTSAEFEKILDGEASTLEPDVRVVYDRYAVPPSPMTYSWDLDGRRVSKTIWVIARVGPRIVGYDEVEAEFGTGLARDGGIVEDWGTYGERLRWTLLRFPEDRLGDLSSEILNRRPNVRWTCQGRCGRSACGAASHAMPSQVRYAQRPALGHSGFDSLTQSVIRHTHRD